MSTTNNALNNVLTVSNLFYGLSAPQNAATGDGTAATIIWNSLFTDRNNNMNVSTGTFTAPLHGLYLCNISLILTGFVAANTSMVVNLVKNGTPYPVYDDTQIANPSTNTTIVRVIASTLLVTSDNTTFAATLTVSGNATKNINIANSYTTISISGPF